VAARVRDLLSGIDVGDRPPQAHDTEASSSSWLPGADFEQHVPRHGDPPLPRHWRERLRWDPGRKAAVALAFAVVAVVVATGWWLAASRPREVPISGSSGTSSVSSSPAEGAVSPRGSSDPASASSSAASTAPVVVDVAGKVRHPGIYRLGAGARVYDAVRAAGGVRPGVSTLSLNLAAPVSDGEQIVVGAPGVPAASDSGGRATGTAARAPGATGSATVIDLNSATLEQLETLPGVGPVLGQHILDWRDAHGRFASIDQLREVSGIGDVRFAQLRPRVTV
jgi:competence protein ComEA